MTARLISADVTGAESPYVEFDVLKLADAVLRDSRIVERDSAELLKRAESLRAAEASST